MYLSRRRVLKYMIATAGSTTFAQFHKAYGGSEGGSGSSDIVTWLEQRPRIAQTISWPSPEGPIRFSQWSEEAREDLQTYFDHAKNSSFPKRSIIPQNQASRIIEDDDYPTTILKRQDAWNIYLSHIANSLLMEMEGVLPWSLQDYGPESLTTMLHGQSFFTWGSHQRISGYKLQVTTYGDRQYRKAHKRSVPSTPDLAFNFLKKNNMIADSAYDTVANVLQWCRRNLYHFVGSYTAANAQKHWGYRGHPPIQRVIWGSNHPKLGMQNFTAGCHGTNFFLQDLLRAVNIPVIYVKRAGHATPYFPSIGHLYLSHGDDPYNQLTKNYLSSTGNPYAVDALFIDRSTHQEWFGLDIAYDAQSKNIGRQPVQLAIQHLPDYLIYQHCRDKRESLSRENSRVFKLFSYYGYSMNDLSNQNLWQRLEAKTKELGGCNYILSVWEWD